MHAWDIRSVLLYVKACLPARPQGARLDRWASALLSTSVAAVLSVQCADAGRGAHRA